MCGGGAKTEKASAAELSLAQHAQKEFDYWKSGGFKQLEDKMINDHIKAGSETKRDIVAGNANVAATEGISKAMPALNPNAGGMQVSKTIGDAGAGAITKAANDADNISTKMKYGGMMDDIATGRGQMDLAVNGIGRSASFAAGNEQANVGLKRAASEFNSEALGQVAGFAGQQIFSGARKNGWFGGSNDNLNDGFTKDASGRIQYQDPSSGMVMDLR